MFPVIIWLLLPECLVLKFAMILFRPKRDFGVTAAIVAAIAVSAAAATAAAVSLASTEQTAATVNNLSAGVAEALAIQGNINSQLKAGIMFLYQRVDLFQEQAYVMMELVQLECEWKYSGLCVPSIPFVNYSHAVQLSHNISQYLTENWSQRFDGLLQELRQSIVHISSTQVDLSLDGGLAEWITITVATSRLKEWAGLAGLASCVVLCSVLVFWCICCMRFQQRRTRALMIQAFAAMEIGQSQVWLGMLEK